MSESVNEIQSSFIIARDASARETVVDFAPVDLPCMFCKNCLIHLFSQFEILVRPTQMDPFSQSLKLPTIHTSFTIKSQLPGLVAFGKNTDQSLAAKEKLYPRALQRYYIGILLS